MADRVTLKNIIVALVVMGAVFVAADLFGLRYDKVEVAEMPGFYAVVSFLTVCGTILLARVLRPIFARREDYYGKVDQTEEEEVSEDV
jgi:hypothetical protein